jgi:hypothetical protein
VSAFFEFDSRKNKKIEGKRPKIEEISTKVQQLLNSFTEIRNEGTL